MNYPAQRQPPLPPMMTVADFLDWPGDGLGTRFELVDGVLRAMPPASDTHGTIQANLSGLLRQHLRDTRSMCRVVANPGIQPRVRAEWNFRIPNIGVTCKQNRAGEVMTPDPILLIEVLSPGNTSDTYENVRAYATLPSVREIAIVHSTRMRIELLVRDAAGDWPADPTVHDGPAVAFGSIGAELLFAEIYAGTHLAAPA